MASSAALLSHFLTPSSGGAIHRAATGCCAAPSSSSNPAPLQTLGGRRQCFLFLALSPAALTFPARSEDVPLFGIRKRIKTIEEEAEKIVAEGEKAVEKEIQAAEKGIEAAKEFQAAEEAIVTSAGLGISGDLLQAVVVAGVEAFGSSSGSPSLMGFSLQTARNYKLFASPLYAR